MHDDLAENPCEIPSLVSLCQRVAANNAACILTLRGSLPAEFLPPILAQADAEDLMRWEEDWPEIMELTRPVWKTVLRKRFPVECQRIDLENASPDSWSDFYLLLKEQESRRFEDAVNKLRTAREEEVYRKQSRMTRVDAKLPAPKQRKYGQSWAPKTPLQKTYTKASRQQQATFARAAPPACPSRAYAALAKKPDILPSPPPAGASTHVSVATVVRQRPTASSSSSRASGSSTRAPSASSVGPAGRYAGSPMKYAVPAGSRAPRAAEHQQPPASTSHTRPSRPAAASRTACPPPVARPDPPPSMARPDPPPPVARPDPPSAAHSPSRPIAPLPAFLPNPPRPPLSTPHSPPQSAAHLIARPSPPNTAHTPPPRPPSPSPAAPPPAKRFKKAGKMACLFMPKHRAHSQIPAGAR
ncbi:hypothetical protein HDZ31DRAFT_59484 [Schizophyllum fasciatum]